MVTLCSLQPLLGSLHTALCCRHSASSTALIGVSPTRSVIRGSVQDPSLSTPKEGFCVELWRLVGELAAS